MYVDDLAQGNGPTITELSSPVAELVPAVAGRKWIGPRGHSVAGEHLGEIGGAAGSGVKTQQLRHFG